MSGFGFDTLALLVVVGMVGPFLTAVPWLAIPVIIGELIAGMAIGRTGFDIVDTTDPTFTLLASIGFALMMFVVGTHVPVRDMSLRASLPTAVLRAVPSVPSPRCSGSCWRGPSTPATQRCTPS